MPDDPPTERALPDGTVVALREATLDDLPFLEEMVVASINGADPEDQWLTVDEIKRDKVSGCYEQLEDLLRRDGDLAVIAEHVGRPVGAAWLRFWTAKDPVRPASYINDTVPVAAIAVVPEMRGRGSGGRAGLAALLGTELANRAGRRGIGQISADIETHNFRSRGSMRKMGECRSVSSISPEWPPRLSFM